MYRYCQCKNGTKKIESHDKYSFSIDCNNKKFLSSTHSESGDDDHLDDQSTNKKENDATHDIKTNHGQEDKEQHNKINDKSIWSIFGINSSANSLNNTLQTNLFTTCMFYIVFKYFMF